MTARVAYDRAWHRRVAATRRVGALCERRGCKCAAGMSVAARVAGKWRHKFVCVQHAHGYKRQIPLVLGPCGCRVVAHL